MSVKQAVIVFLMVMFGHQYNAFAQIEEKSSAVGAERRSLNGKKGTGKNRMVVVELEKDSTSEDFLSLYNRVIKPPDNASLLIRFKTKRALCFADSSEKACRSASILPRSSAFKNEAKNLYKVVVEGETEYVSPFAIESSCPSIKLFRLQNSHLIKKFVIPRSSKNNLIIELINTQPLAQVVDTTTNGKPIGEFYFDQSLQPSITISLLQLSNLADFTVKTSAQNVNVKIPNVENGRLRNVEFKYRGRHPEHISLDYSAATRGMQSLTISINSFLESFRYLLPPIHIQNKIPVINLAFRNINHAYEFLSTNSLEIFYQLSAEHKKQAKKSDRKYLEQISTPNPPEVTLPNGEIKQHYVMANLKTIIQNAKRGKVNVVNTYCLVIDEPFPDAIPLAKSITINFSKMVYINYRHVYSFKLIKFKQIDDLVAQTWSPLTMVQIYDCIIDILKHVRPATFSISNNLRKIIGDISLNFLHQIKQFTQLKKQGMISGLNAVNRHYMENLMIRGNDLIMFANNQKANMKRLPRLSQKLYSKKTLLYQDMVKLLIGTKQIQGLQRGQKLLLSAAKIKTETQISLTQEEGKLLEVMRKQSLIMLKKLQGKRQSFEREVEQGTAVFQAAVKRRQRQAVLDAVVSFFSAITSIFTGGISGIEKVGDVFKKFERMLSTIRKIANMIKRITALIETLGGLASNVMDSYNKVNVAQEGFDPGFTIKEQKEINWDKYDKQTKDYSDRKLNDILKQTSKLNAFEVLEWDLAKAHVEGMMDASLSAEIPEALSYKKAILQLIAAGKAHTEAAIDFVQLKVDIYMNEYRQRAYGRELGAITDVKGEMIKAFDNQEFHGNLKIAEKQLKVELFLHINDYCDAQFYYTLSSCFIFSEFSFKYSLEHTQYILSKMLIESLDKINDLYPPPQTIKETVLEYKEKPECGDYMSSLKLILKSTECQKLGSVSCGNAVKKFLLSKLPKDASEKLIDKEVTQKTKLYMDCLASPVFQLKEKKTATISITMDEQAFKGLDRIRIDDIKVRFNGVTASKGFITVLISNGGICEDRLRGKKFAFSGDMWRRMYRYKLGSSSNSEELSGDVYKEFDYLFNKPTPFSSWVISLPDYKEEGVNLEGVTSISLIFSGTFMMSSSLHEEVILFEKS